MGRMFTLEFAKDVLDDLKALRAPERKRILDRIDEQLLHNPTEETRNKKSLVGLKPPWEHEEPVWELRIGKYRVFYDVNEEEQQVIVRAVREKPPHQSTEEIL
jgi:mRNA-degrading endonuclease RelE of RelBE toxin-antitoxin system